MVITVVTFVISLTKGMNVSNTENELREIYKITLSTDAISIITNKVMQAASLEAGTWS